MKMEIVQVTPKIAAAWLEKNTENRPLSRQYVNKLADEMRRGDWIATHQSIAFTKTGRMIDGQHRLQAVIASGSTVAMSVVRDVPDRAFIVTDTGRKRGLRFLTGLPGRLCDAASFIGLVVNNGNHQGGVSSQIVQRIGDAVEPYHSELLQACGSNLTKRTAAAIRGAATLRLIGATEKQRAFVLEQYPAFVHLRVTAMAPSMGALLKKFESYPHVGGAEARQAIGATAWLAFDVANKSRAALRVANWKEQFAEMKKAILPLIEAQEARKAA